VYPLLTDPLFDRTRSSGAPIVIVGLGKTGLSCVRYLHPTSMPLVVVDSREMPAGLSELQAEFLDVRFISGEFSTELFLKAGILVVSPGVSCAHPAIAAARAAGIPVVGDIELFARAVSAPVVAVTGSNAKGTVTTCVAEMARVAGKSVILCGNIGLPVLDTLSEPAPDLYVLELSSFQLETTYSLHHHIAAFLNLSADHLDRYSSMQFYREAKQRIFKGCAKAICARDVIETYPAPEYESIPTITFGLDAPELGMFGIREQKGKTYLAEGSTCLLPTDALKIAGRHNWLNALAALALARAADIPLAPALEALQQFPGLPHRCAWVRTLRDIRFYNDSKGTNVGATIAALEGLGGAMQAKLVLIAGGQGKGADFTALRAPIAQYARAVVLLGQDGPLLAQALADTVPLHTVDTLESAVQCAADLAASGDAVLLSPACASLDMFPNFEVRGDMFIQAVEALQ